jgi:glycosyltransferase involved in cell wall biosynthesis
MRVSLIAPPFIPVPPVRYGGTELFIAQLAEGLKELGADVIVYANGESTVNVETRWLYEQAQWPIGEENQATFKDLNHTSWALNEAWENSDIIHCNNLPGLAFSRFPGPNFVYTLHHSHHEWMSTYYANFPDVNFVTISRFQQQRESMPRLRTIHHGIDLNQYMFQPKKQDYLAFLGRIAPLKGTHNAIAVAKKSGIPLKIAGEVQPMYKAYFEAQVKPHIDGKFIEYIGEADLIAKNELLGNALAMLFPIQWDEPFGLVLVEAMATGTPVLAFAGGSVKEIVTDDVSGYICGSVDEMAKRARNLSRLDPHKVREFAEQYFSVQRMVRDYADLYEDILQERAGQRSSHRLSLVDPDEPWKIA